MYIYAVYANVQACPTMPWISTNITMYCCAAKLIWAINQRDLLGLSGACTQDIAQIWRKDKKPHNVRVCSNDLNYCLFSFTLQTEIPHFQPRNVVRTFQWIKTTRTVAVCIIKGYALSKNQVNIPCYKWKWSARIDISQGLTLRHITTDEHQ